MYLLMEGSLIQVCQDRLVVFNVRSLIGRDLSENRH
jgi:hypothetical protein